MSGNITKFVFQQELSTVWNGWMGKLLRLLLALIGIEIAVLFLLIAITGLMPWELPK